MLSMNQLLEAPVLAALSGILGASRHAKQLLATLPVPGSSIAAACAGATNEQLCSRAYSSTSWPSIGPAQLPTHRIVVTGYGMVTPLGVGADATWKALVQGACGIRQVQPEDLPEAQRGLLPELACRVAAFIPRQPLEQALQALGTEDARRQSRFIQLALLAGEEALTHAGWHPATAQQRARSGVCVGSGMSCTGDVAEAAALLASGRSRRISPFFVPRILPNMAAGALSIRHGLQGPSGCTATACAAGAHALGDAFRVVQRGHADVMLAGASEACIDALSLTGFARLKALSTQYNNEPHKASRPFDRGRDGFVMGEGAAMVVLERLEHALARNAHIYAELRGYGASADAHHITHPHPQGEGAKLAMQRALHGSGLLPQHVTYINAHATSTPAGDEIEAAAILDVFGSHASSGGVAVSSTKGATGHLLGAAGAAEAVISLMALHHALAPPTLNLEQPEPSSSLCLIGPPAQAGSGHEKHGSLVTGPHTLPEGPKAVMSNSFGFGGTNASLLFATTPPQA